MTKRFEVRVWETADRPVGRVLVLPGGAYTVDHPILYWASQVAAGAKWQVSTMRWQVDESAQRDPTGFVDPVPAPGAAHRMRPPASASPAGNSGPA